MLAGNIPSTARANVFAKGSFACALLVQELAQLRSLFSRSEEADTTNAMVATTAERALSSELWHRLAKGRCHEVLSKVAVFCKSPMTCRMQQCFE